MGEEKKKKKKSVSDKQYSSIINTAQVSLQAKTILHMLHNFFLVPLNVGTLLIRNIMIKFRFG